MKRYAISFVVATIFSVSYAQVPTAPGNCSGVGASRKSITANWSESAADENNLVLEYARTGKGDWSGVVLPADTTSFTISGLKRKTSYDLRVKATNEYGSSAYSNVATTSTLK